MTHYDYCCSEDGHGLKYPGFSVVFLQVFPVEAIKDFVMPAGLLRSGCIKPVENGIDNLIFNTAESNADNIQRYELPGFDFTMPLKTPYPITFSGHVKVKMSVLFKNAISISYRFVFDGSETLCKMSEAASTDHVIALLATHLSAEHWSKNKGKSETDINMEISGFQIDGFRIDENGCYIAGQPESFSLDGAGRVFDRISSRYKLFIKNSCTRFKKSVTKEQRIVYKKKYSSAANNSVYDFHYAMVDIWEDVMHPVIENGSIDDLFGKERAERLSEAEVVNHIRDNHKPELIGLMTLYPGEWPYRDAKAYDEVCGENIAIDTDDLVLVNNNVCVVIGTYGRRGADSPVDWKEHLEERSRYDVSWPEYLLILEMVIAKKFMVMNAKDQLIEATLTVDNVSSSELIAHNASLSMRLSRLVLQLDVVKYSRFMSHKVMFDRTTRRLELDKDIELLNRMMDIVDNSLRNLSDYKSMKSDSMLNFILVLISMASTFQLFFMDSEMPFLSQFGLPGNKFATSLLWVVATITVFAVLLMVYKLLRSICERIKNML